MTDRPCTIPLQKATVEGLKNLLSPGDCMVLSQCPACRGLYLCHFEGCVKLCECGHEERSR